MLSASTISSPSSSAFTSSGVSTPSSQYSTESRKTNGNPLTELIETEQSFMETLKMIDSQIAPIWMKQMTSAAPDFSELLKYIHDILKVNKRFCTKLTIIASNPQSISELGDTLMQWVNDLETPYANYSRSYIPNLNQRQDILRNSAIQGVLQNLSRNVSYEINLESLFNAPIQQLKYYKGVYNRLLEGADPGKADHKLLLNANKRIDMIMKMSKNNVPVKQANYTSAPSLPMIQTNFQSSSSELVNFEHQVDCSRVVDVHNGQRINYQLRLSNPGTELVMRDSFVMLPIENGPSISVHLLLTTEVLVVCRTLNTNQYLLMYPAIPIGDITVKSESLDREAVGEYIIRFSILGKKHLVIRADSKNIRNTWIGADPEAPSSVILTPRTLSVAAQKKMLANSRSKEYEVRLPAVPPENRTIKSKNIRNTDIFAFYSESGNVSPLESSDEEEEDVQQGKKSRDTIMDIYENHIYDDDYENIPPVPSKTDLANIAPQTVKILPHVPNVPQAQQTTVFTNGGMNPTPPNKDRSNVKGNLPPIPPNKQMTAAVEPVKESAHVQMTYIEPPTSQLATMTVSPPIPHQNQLNNPSLPSSSSLQNKSLPPGMNHTSNKINPLPSPRNDGKPASPRAVEVQRAVIPEVMQAVTQKTDDYISHQHQYQQNDNRFDNRPPQPRSDSAQQVPMIPRNSSMRGPGQQQQQRPQMMHNSSYSGQPHSPMLNNKPLPGQPHPQMNQQQQRPGMNPQGHNRPNPSPPAHQQPMSYNNARPMHNQQTPSPSPSVSNSARRPPANQSSHLQQPPGRFNSPSPSLTHMQANGNSMDDLSSPPHSPNFQNPGNDVRQILYSNTQCNVFHWNNQSWYAAEGQCLLQVRLTHRNRTCVAVQLQNTGQLYLNAWVLPTTVIRQPSPTDVSISLYMGSRKENYLVHFSHPQDANVFANILHKAHQESNNLPMPSPHREDLPEIEEPEPVDNVNVPQTLKPVMQCKAKLFIKNETSNWSTFGSVTMRISQQAPSMRMLIQIENDKSKLVSAIVKSGNVEKISSKRISFLLNDDVSKTSIVYMVHLREDQTGKKIYEYLRTKNAENGW